MLADKPCTLIDALLHWAEETPDKTFIRSCKGDFSFRETLEASSRLAGFLTASGIPAGARVCLLLPRTPELILSFLAANMAGCLPAPVNYLEPWESIERTLQSLAPAVVVVDEAVVGKHAMSILRQGRALVVSAAERPGADGVQAWDRCIGHAPLPDPGQRCRVGSVAYLNFTTGSTGQPKGALCTQANLYWNTRSAAEAFQLTDEDVHLCMFAPFAHPHELFCRALYTGGSLALLPEISPKAIVRAVGRHKVTCMMGLAVMYRMMAEHCGKTDLPSLRIAESGGMFTAPELLQGFLDAFGVPLLSAWGSTETAGIALANSLHDWRADGSAGRACPYYQVRLADEDGREVRTGEVGELLFSGPALAAGYWDGTPLPGEDGWYRSGDLARRDADGFYHFAERKSGMIKVAGLKVYPLQVELALQQHPGVREAAVVGVGDRRRGCVPKAFVSLRDGVRLDAEDLVRFCRTRLAPYMVPRQFQFLDELPKTGSGKLLKKALLNFGAAE